MKHIKHILLQLYLLLGASFAFGQAYVPFPDSNAVWHEKETNCYPPCQNSYHKKIYYGDTIINGNTYKKVYRGKYESYQSGFSSYKGAIREESKVTYLVMKDSTDEKMLYDFNKQVGDTLFFPGRTGSPLDNYDIITAIDSVLIKGSYRKRYELDNWGIFNDYIIEGIGSLFGLLYPWHFPQNDVNTHGGVDLICFRYNDQILYSRDNDTSNCYLVADVKEEDRQELSEAIVYPNPNDGRFIVSFNGLIQRPAMITIADMMGRIVLEEVFQGQGYEVDMSGYNAGVYVVGITVGERHVKRKVICY